MTYDVTIDGVTRSVSVTPADGGWSVSVDGGPARVVRGKSVGAAEWIFEGRRHGVFIDGDHLALQVEGHGLSGTVVDPREAALGFGGGGALGTVTTSMPGVVVRLLVSEGQTVAEGDVLLVVEAMKMENEFRAPCDGTVERLHVEPGTAVEANAVLATIEPA